MSQAAVINPTRPDYLQDGLTEAERQHVLETYGAYYWEKGTKVAVESDAEHLYYFKTYVGAQAVTVERGDSIWYLSEDLETAVLQSGPTYVESAHWATVIRGYTPSARTVGIKGLTTLPYVNGCSTKQLFEPIRIGDPTLQYLHIPAYSKEQAHHIHSTVRVVYVLEGKGVSVVGMEGREARTELLPGMVVYLEPMSPHHFETPQGEHIRVIPLHVFSSAGPIESNHPMFNGTHLMNQGA